VKPCAHCGTALENGATACLKCERSCDDKVRLNPNLHPAQPYPRYSIWGDLIVAALLACVGYYFFGPLGALAGLALGAVIAFGI
jgi:hypothetical protein